MQTPPTNKRGTTMKEIRDFSAAYMSCVIGMFAFAASPGCLGSDSAAGEDPRIEVRCGVDLGLTPESGVIEDWAGATRSWGAVAEEDTLTLTRRYSCGDECSMTEEIVLAGISEECPRFVSASVTRTDAGGALGSASKTTRAEKGTLEIEEWNPKAGVVSGRLESDARFVFYIAL
jgi:hypothetical protein